ncbi:MAG: hypothetical protein ABSD98_10540 [Candidatus Korobacteraceae bacterium]|jgi:hypothetical protein
MSVNFLEELVAEWYEYKGYFIRRNARVGPLPRGGYECELDVVAFDPKTKQLVHIETSSDANSWKTREGRFTKKFEAGRKYIPGIFSGLLPDSPSSQIDQIALIAYMGKTPRSLAGAKAISGSAFLKEIVDVLSSSEKEVPEQFFLLRTVHWVAYYRKELFEQPSGPVKTAQT